MEIESNKVLLKETGIILSIFKTSISQSEYEIMQDKITKKPSTLNSILSFIQQHLVDLKKEIITSLANLPSSL